MNPNKCIINGCINLVFWTLSKERCLTHLNKQEIKEGKDKYELKQSS